MPKNKKHVTALSLLAVSSLALTSCTPIQIFGAAHGANYSSTAAKCSSMKPGASPSATLDTSDTPADPNASAPATPDPASSEEDSDGLTVVLPSATATAETIEVPPHLVPLFKQASEETGIPYSVIAAQIWQESRFNSDAVSYMGARGIAQMMPATWAGLEIDGDPHDDEAAMRGYIKLMNQYRGIVEHLADNDTDRLKFTLAAYNAGPGPILSSKGVPPIGETQHYVEVILGNQQIVFSEGKGSSNCQRTPGLGWDGDLGDGEWTNPCPGCVLTSGYGWRDLGPGYPDWMDEHVGIDLASTGGGRATIISPTHIKIVNIDPNFGCVVGQMPDTKLQLNFCHLETWEVSVGDELQRGDVIGLEGGRGPGGPASFAPHLHFEIFDPESPVPAWPYNGHNIDPMPILLEKGAAPAA